MEMHGLFHAAGDGNRYARAALLHQVPCGPLG